MKKIKKYLKFCIENKIPQLLKKVPDKKLLELYDEYCPYVYHRTKTTPPVNVIYGTIITILVVETFKRRYEIPSLSYYDYTKELNLHEIIRQHKYNGTN